MRTLFLDLDGVFANFTKAFREHTGLEHYDNPKKSWGILEKVDNLFLHLEPFPYAKDMFEEIKNRSVYDIKFLTALPRLSKKLKTAPQDKVNWIREYLCLETPVICSNGWSDKKRYCSPGDILVDDMERNIVDWKTAGGVGILHTDPANTISLLSGYNILR